ncbi:MAG: 1-acyl-sn-glycerol-3-phosphate acyltransferase [Muribaculaceae bacterium]|nr:1-acyl-sn-glycerol-3-phosphate acyltransferase [Muribaculaceae bacterium]
MMVLYRIYQVLVMIPVLLVATVLTATVTAVGSILGGGRWWGYYPAHLWARLFCLMTFVKVTVKGGENIGKDTSYVFVANHQGAYDIFAVYGYLGHNFKWMMKKSLEKIPLVGYACKKAGHVFVDNTSPAAVRRTMEVAEKQLGGGMSVVVFPEGSRSFTGKMRKFKRGAYQLAVEFGLPVVPITIDGAFEVMPRTARLPKWGHIRLTIHKPVEAPDGGHDLQSLMEGTYNVINGALPERYR